MLSNAYFLANFRFGTAENEPAQNLQNFAKFANFADPNPLTLTRSPELAWLVAAFRRADADADGLLRPAELRAALFAVVSPPEDGEPNECTH